jgi:8-oxo-dGTP pyrophosphatase MutT (NUDIX family)
MIKTIKKNIILDNNFMIIENNDVLFNDKHKGTHIKLYPKTIGSVVVIPFNSDGDIIIQDEFRYGVDDYVTQLVAGGIKAEQTPIEAAMAELNEELGLFSPNLLNIGKIKGAVDVFDHDIYLYVAYDCIKSTKITKRDNSEFFRNQRVISLDDLLTICINNDIKCMHTTNIIFKYFIMKQKGQL